MSEPNTTEGERALNLDEAATYLQVGRCKVQRLAEQGFIPGRKLGRDWRFSRSGLDDWLSNPITPQPLPRQMPTRIKQVPRVIRRTERPEQQGQ